jgi:hypothetical protein
MSFPPDDDILVEPNLPGKPVSTFPDKAVAFVSRLGPSMEHPGSNFHAELTYRNAKSPVSAWRPGFVATI